jgi:DNA-binding NarL/FixJ family response regulator
LDSRWQNVRRDLEHLEYCGADINLHINNAISKLNAANKPAVAVKAAMLGFL